MDALLHNGKVIALGGTRSQRRRGMILPDGRLAERQIDITGLKVVEVTFNDKTRVRTPYGIRSIRRRRAANKVAKQARKVNR